MKEQKKSWFRRHPVWTVVIVLVFMNYLIIMAVILSGDNSKQKSINKVFKTEPCIISTNYMDDFLKSPSTADYGSCNGAKITNLGDSTYEVLNYVDSQNSFGATIRTYYQMELRYNGGEWADRYSWTLIDYEIE